MYLEKKIHDISLHLCPMTTNVFKGVGLLQKMEKITFDQRWFMTGPEIQPKDDYLSKISHLTGVVLRQEWSLDKWIGR